MSDRDEQQPLYQLSHSYTLGPLPHHIERLANIQIADIRARMALRPMPPDGLRLATFPSNTDVLRVVGKAQSAELYTEVARATARAIGADGVAVTLVPIHAEEYFAWLGTAKNTPEKRNEYVTRAWKKEPAGS